MISLFFLGTVAATVSFAVVEPATKAATKKVIAEVVPDAMGHMMSAPNVDIESLRDPFASFLAMVEMRGRQAIMDRQSRMEDRMREPLEDFDLSELKLVAIMEVGDDKVAMVEDVSGMGFLVRRGNYMGKHSGRIERISDESVFLVEQMLNPAGDVVDNQVELTLKEVNQ
ncbi:MAG: pilus assembly protein PilP [Mariprofundaceae bacterium]